MKLLGSDIYQSKENQTTKNEKRKSLKDYFEKEQLGSKRTLFTRFRPSIDENTPVVKSKGCFRCVGISETPKQPLNQVDILKN